MPGIAFDAWVQNQAKSLRQNDRPPSSKEMWETKRTELLKQIHVAAGIPAVDDTALNPNVLKTEQREGYSIQLMTFQSQADIAVTATLYVPAIAAKEKVPAVLCVHGHWGWARREPTVHARCVGLVKLGFLVMVVDAFGAGERHHDPARGRYHGSLYGATLWPSGQTLLGRQVYDNHRAVDYLLSRPDVNGKIGITGASGGGNQTMYAGALDSRITAVVPVCSVGNYQAYLHAACCLCEVLPKALTFTEEGNILGLVAPRALMVINAAKDSIQFSPPEAEKSIVSAKQIFALYGKEKHLKHVVIDSGHDYNLAMRQAMYGWMCYHLQGVGDGSPIMEPKSVPEEVATLTCYPEPEKRPKNFGFLPTIAAAVGRKLHQQHDKLFPDHKEMWEADSISMGKRLETILNTPSVPQDAAIRWLDQKDENNFPFELETKEGFIHYGVFRGDRKAEQRTVHVVVHLGGVEDAIEKKLVPDNAKNIIFIDLRASGKSKSKWGPVAGSPDHTSAEHAIWIGRPLLGLWQQDLLTLIKAWKKQRGYDLDRFRLYSVRDSAVVAIITAATSDDVEALEIKEVPYSFVSDQPYASGTHLGTIVPGILNAGDIPHLLARVAPKPLTIQTVLSPFGTPISPQGSHEAFRFTYQVYKILGAEDAIEIKTN